MSARTRHELAAILLERASRLTGEQTAFAVGKAAAANGELLGRAPYGSRCMRAAWVRGHTYEANRLRGLLPLDTARRLP